MMYAEDDLLPLSALQHLLFCERQAALIHVERLWAENRWTAEGRHLHENAHSGEPETRDGVRITRGLPVVSFSLGLTGQADVIEWTPHATGSRSRPLREVLRDATEEERRAWTVLPIEYKRGKPKRNDCDRVQVCAQAMCLEEMLPGVTIPEGRLFYGEKRRRFDVVCDEKLRSVTTSAAVRMHEIVRERLTPAAVDDARCDSCSLKEHCLPVATSPHRSAQTWLDRMLDDGEASRS